MSNLKIVQFHNKNLFIVDHNKEPYTPMKPIVEGMWLTWGSQQQKIRANSKRWQGISLKAIPSIGGIQTGLCMPVRKLPAFMASIHPSRVKPELRETIELYQDECDNALWSYWSEGQAINPRATISPAQQRMIQETVSELAIENKAYAKYYGAIKTHFKIAKHDQLPVDQPDS